VRGSIIENEDHGMYLTTQRFGNDLLLHEGLEIDKAFALPTRSVDLAIGDREGSLQMAGSTTMIACFVQEWLAWMSGARRLLTLASLDGSFLIQTDEPGSLEQKGLRLAVGVQDWTGS
jgi:hypothetical protein